MDMNSLSIGPFSEGFIRVATTVDPATSNMKFSGAIEVLARHHASADDDANSNMPRLARHPVAVELLEREPANKAAGHIVEVPIRMFFNKTSNALTVKYQAYDSAGRPVCVGNGCNAKRTSIVEGGQPVSIRTPCVGSEACEFANTGEVACRRQVKMPVQLKQQDNPLSVFEVRTSSYNAYKALRAQLELIESRFGGLRHVPLKLKLWQASNEASNFELFDLFKLTLDSKTEVDAMREAKKAREEEVECGLAAEQDATYEKLQAGAGDDGGIEIAFDDFNEVQDFYRPIATPKPERRKGSQSVASTMTRKTPPKTAPNLAADLISSSLQKASLGTSAEQTTSTA